MKRAALTRKTPMARGSSQLRRSAMPRGRPGKQPPHKRDDAFKRFVLTLECCAPKDPRYPCWGPMTPSHKHEDGKGIKSHDRTLLPKCVGHHGQYEDKSGVFKGFTKQQTRDWHDNESARVIKLYEEQRRV
jgi:hypothetical protein